MVTSLAFILLFALVFSWIFQKLKLPKIIGMLAVGILLGPFVLDLLDDKILSVSSDLRQIALIVILIKAGLSLNVSDLKKVGRPAILMSFLPAVFEIGAVALFAPYLLPVSRLDALIMGAVLGAVSPAVVVPRMVELNEKGYGTDKQIPGLILAGASLDDVFVIVLFTAFCSLAQGESFSVMQFVSVPLSVVLGIGSGVAVGFLLSFIFEFAHKKQKPIRQSVKVIVLLGVSFLLMSVEIWQDTVPFSGLIAVMAMATVVQLRCRPTVGSDLSKKFGKLWLFAEILLFVLVGSAVDIRYTLKAGGLAVLVIFIALAVRSVGVLLCLIGTPLNKKERLYCVISYLPKATVQAAIGSVPLSLGLSCGNIVLSVAVLSILITAPLGAFLMDLTYPKLLSHNE